MIDFNKPLYPDNPCPGCERGEPLEELAGLSELLKLLPPGKIELGQDVQLRTHLPSDTFCWKFMPLEMAKANPNAKRSRTAHVMTKAELLEG
jgi:hypothetical protein